MYCDFKEDKCVRCKFNLKNFGVYDLARVTIDGSDRTQLNWSEISVPEILKIPCQKPDIEQLDQVFVDAKLTNVKLIETPFAYKSYDREARAFEITAVTTAITDTIAVTNAIVTVLTDADAVLAVPPSVVPEVTVFENARQAVSDANLNLIAKIAEVQAIIGAPCVSAENLIEILEALNDAIEVLLVALIDLVTAGTALQAASTTDISAEITTMNDSIFAAQAIINTAVQSIEAGFDLIGNTKYFEIIENEEGLCLSGRKIIIEGVLSQKVVYTGLVTTQSVHSACYEVPFTAYIIPYAKFDGLFYEEDVTVITGETAEGCETKTINGFAYNPNEPIQVDAFEEFSVDVHIEDIFATMLDCRTVFKNITLFFIAKPIPSCLR